MSESGRRRAVAYLRFSSEMQRDTWTIDAQRHEYEEFVAAKGWDSVAEYVDEARRASSDDIAKRPAFGRLLADIRSRSFDTVVVHENSRLARNQLVFQQFLKVCREAGVRLVSIAEAIDTTTADGEMLMGLLMQFSQHASKVLGTHVAKAKRERVRRGLSNGAVPFGYRRCECGQGPEGKCRGHAPVPVQEEFAAVREAFEHYASGVYTASDIAARLNAAGFRTRNTRKDPEVGVVGPRPFGKESVVDMLRNPFHAGKVRYHDGDLVDGAHEAAVSWEVFQRVQAELDRHARHGRSDRTKRVYLLNGLLRCVHCGERLWAISVTRSKTRHGHATEPLTYARYRSLCHDRGNHACPSGDTSVPAPLIDGQVETVIKTIHLSEDWELAARRILEADEERANVEQRRAAVQERLRRTARAYADGNLDEADYERRKREAEAELASLVVPEEQAVLDAGSYLSDVGRIWDGVDVPMRRSIVQALFDAIYVDVKSKKVEEYRPKAAFRRLLLDRRGVNFGDPDGDRTRISERLFLSLGAAVVSSGRSRRLPASRYAAQTAFRPAPRSARRSGASACFRSQVRVGSIPDVMAALRNTMLGLLRTAGETHIAAATRRFAAQPWCALRLLGIIAENQMTVVMAKADHSSDTHCTHGGWLYPNRGHDLVPGLGCVAAPEQATRLFQGPMCRTAQHVRSVSELRGTGR